MCLPATLVLSLLLVTLRELLFGDFFCVDGYLSVENFEWFLIESIREVDFRENEMALQSVLKTCRNLPRLRIFLALVH